MCSKKELNKKIKDSSTFFPINATMQKVETQVNLIKKFQTSNKPYEKETRSNACSMISIEFYHKWSKDEEL